MTMHSRGLWLAMAAMMLAAGAPAVGAQGAAQRQQPARQAAPGQGRQALERQVRARIHRVMRENLRLTDDQLARLDRTMGTFEDRRRALLREERQLRITLRQSMGEGGAVDSSTVDQAAIARALDSLIDLQRRRISLVEDEQRELATFLTPLQRARFFALQDNLRRMLEDRAMDAPGAAGRARQRGGGAQPPE